MTAGSARGCQTGPSAKLRDRGREAAILRPVRDFPDGRIANIFPEDCKSGCDAHTAATIFDTEAASHGAKNRSPVSDPEKGILPRDTGLRARPWAIFGARRVSASDSRDLTMSFRDWQRRPQSVGD